MKCSINIYVFFQFIFIHIISIYPQNMSTVDESMPATSHLVAARFSILDYVIFCTMLVVSTGIGVYSAIKSRGRETTQDFLVGGRDMSPYPVAISLLGGIFSAISILGMNCSDSFIHLFMY